ncbi:AAEL012901-PA [Aedes aegypti]|uniref:AAEL012901-PA n=2 Tax=Aedes aegypti TaxID=7159 RepID=A0A1S4FXF9_AEDAE|nr:prisilkin-39 [Aedes aegypti]EAT34907.1 AAEL012901-PA [Aedes aegypti]
MKFVVVVICAVVGVALGESADDQQADVVNGQNQPQAQDRLFELSRKSRQLFGTAYPYSGGLTQGAYPYPVGTGISAYSGYSGYPTTGLGFNSGQYSAALYGGGPYAAGSYGTGGYGAGAYGAGAYGAGSYGAGVYGGGLYGAGGYGGGLYGGSGLGYNGYGGYSQFANDPYSAIGSRGFVPSNLYRRAF